MSAEEIARKAGVGKQMVHDFLKKLESSESNPNRISKLSQTVKTSRGMRPRTYRLETNISKGLPLSDLVMAMMVVKSGGSNFIALL
jgi:hypothetical protein